LYSSPRYLARRGQPTADLAGHDVILYSGELEPAARALDLPRIFAGARIACRTNSMAAVATAAAAGLGLALLATPLGDADPQLARIGRRSFGRRDAWLLVHQGVRKNARVRALWSHLVAHFKAR